MSIDPHFERASELFLELRELTPEVRAGALRATAERESAECMALVERLLAGELQADAVDALEREVSAVRNAAAVARYPEQARELPFEQLGPYLLIAKVGEGGMGAVYEARQLEPVVRRVALKLVRPALDSAKLAARFQAERQTLARMDHPHIARVFDAGESPAGLLYFAMEFVEGPTLMDFCKAKGLGLEQRLALFIVLCDTVRHAHQKGVVHRDLKPSNVLVAELDGRPHLQVIDFGIAKVLEPSGRPDSVVTEAAELLGTPLYMSPEQARGSRDVDTRSDVYALGILLFELLTGGTPIRAQELREAGPLGLAGLVAEREVPRPSTRCDDDSPAAADELRGDLDWIVLRATASEPDRRYATADALGADLGRYLADQPIEARPPSLGYTASKFVRRHRLGIATAGLVAAAVLGGSVVAILALRRERDALAELVEQSSENARYFAAERTASASRAIADGQPEAARAQLDAIPPADRGFEWHWTRSALIDASRPLHGDFSNGSRALDANAQQVAQVQSDGQVLLSDPHDPTLAALRLGRADALDVAYLPDGKLVVLRTGGLHDLWSPAGERLRSEHAPHAGAERLLLGLDSILSIGRNGRGCRWSHSLELDAEFNLGHDLGDAALSPDGRWIGAIDGTGVATLFDAASLELRARVATDPRQDSSVAFTADSGLLLVGGTGGVVRAIDPLTAQVVLELRSSAFSVSALHPLADRRFLAASIDGTLTECDARTGEVRRLLLDPERVVEHIAVADAFIVFGQNGRPPVRWNRSDLVGSTWHRAHDELVFEVVPVDAAGTLASVGADGRLCVWGPDAGTPSRTLTPGGTFIYSLAVDDKFRRAMTYADDRRLRAWSLPEWTPLWEASAASGVRNVAQSPDGSLLAGPSSVSDPEGLPIIGLWDAVTGQERLQLKGHTGTEIFRMAFDGSGARLASTSASGETHIWSTTDGELLIELPARPGARSGAVAFSPDGRRLYTGHGDGRLCSWNAATGEPLYDVPAHIDIVGSIEVSADGRRVLTSGWYNGAVHLWHADTGRRQLTLETGIRGLSDASFGHDERSISAAGMEGGLRTWAVRRSRH